MRSAGRLVAVVVSGLLVVWGCGGSGGGSGAATPTVELSFAEELYGWCTAGVVSGVGEIGSEQLAEIDAEFDELYPGFDINVPEPPDPMGDSECQGLADCVTERGITREDRRQAISEAPALGRAYSALADLFAPCYPPRWSKYLKDFTDFFNWVVYDIQTHTSTSVPENLRPEEGEGFNALSEVEQTELLERLQQLENEIQEARGDMTTPAFQLSRLRAKLKEDLEHGYVIDYENEYCEARLDAQTRNQRARDIAQKLYDEAVQYSDYFRVMAFVLRTDTTLDILHRSHTQITENSPPCAEDFTLLQN